MEQVYRVLREDDEGWAKHKLGYATGDPKDIEVHYDNRPGYRILLEPLEVFIVEPESVKERRDLLEERNTLEERLKEVKEHLRQ